ncbi:hydroxyisourate hydrolase [Pantoea agglomerans]|jgi:5-hydroxyisourate hydrolase
MNTITTHVLDTAVGKPATGVSISLEKHGSNGWQPVSKGSTDADGRIKDLTPQGVGAGQYRLVADLASFFAASGRETLYASAQIDFVLPEQGGHYHLPFLISPWSWSTYRGS